MIKRSAKQGKWIRTFDTAKQGYLYRGETDSPPLVIEGLRFDGNRTEGLCSRTATSTAE